MSEYGEEILDRLPENSSLKSSNNPARKVIMNTVGEWLDNYDDNFENMFLNESIGEYIDCHGREYGVYRKLNETDENYKKRIIYQILGHLTADYLINIYKVNLYVNIPNYNPNNNELTSDNQYINDENGFMASADDVTRSILNKKFVLESGIRWL
ncbi:hypothetical protein [uncultured Methanobrevibacter sp.]|uniref:hypothetical protein n=1 Tax=uncultured Methanobrevibacter sp. TaxID=253161 RepID=UPI0025CF2297|nr:hypothetical protein [uncultured Methanobrevibacter sp.]